MNKKLGKYMTDALIFISAVADEMAKQCIIEQETSKMPPINMKNMKEDCKDVDAV